MIDFAKLYNIDYNRKEREVSLMKSVTVCRGCGRTIENDFIYCPWCGYSRVASDDSASLDAVFSQLEHLQTDSRIQQINSMEKQLDDLEHELDTLVLSTEMHK